LPFLAPGAKILDRFLSKTEHFGCHCHHGSTTLRTGAHVLRAGQRLPPRSRSAALYPPASAGPAPTTQ
jgi:hypothetical protein